MSIDVLIIGGGLSGLSTAVDLCARGVSVSVFERGPRLGGRAYSFTDETTGEEIDNGQHLMMGCYHQTRWLLGTIGSEHHAALQPNLHIDVVHPGIRATSLRCPALPGPLHLLTGLMGFNLLTFGERLSLLKVGVEIHKHPESIEPSIANLTVRQWLDSLGQSENSQRYLWDVIAIGSLNGDPGETSALLLYRVLRAAFLGDRSNSSLLVPRAGLSRLFAEPALHYIESKGGRVFLQCGVEELMCEGARVRAVRCSDGTRHEAKTFVSAVPWHSISGLLPSTEPSVKFAAAMTASAILSVNLWFDRQVIDRGFVALLDSRVQWVFNKSKLHRDSAGAGQCLALTVSGANRFVDMEPREIVELVCGELRAVFPQVSSARLVHSVVLKEKRATFSQTPRAEFLRPGCTTSLTNFFLAGDWTNTGYPATIEGAVMSGRNAATAALNSCRSTGQN
jgi:squalene-associated FAD-dependent desaturase